MAHGSIHLARTASSERILCLIILLEVFLSWGEGWGHRRRWKRGQWPSGFLHQSRPTGTLVETVQTLPLVCQFGWKSPWKRLQATGIVFFFGARKIAGNNGTKLKTHYSLTCLRRQPRRWHPDWHEIRGPSLPREMNTSVPSTEIHLPLV